MICRPLFSLLRNRFKGRYATLLPYLLGGALRETHETAAKAETTQC